MKRFFATLIARIADAQTPALVLAGCALWLAASPGLRPLALPDEGRYIGVAWEMLNSGNWLVPTLDGMPFFHKPPLFYWITAFALKLFGATEWAGRFASLIGALTAAFALYLFARRHAERRTANLSLAILTTLPFFFVGAQYANLDMLVAGMISATILFGADAVLARDKGQPHRSALTAAYAFAALGVLAKGLIGIVLPGAVLFAWLILSRRLRLLPALFRIGPLVLFVAIAAPWFVLLERAYPGFLHYFFVYHHFQRFAETGFNNQQAFWFYVPVLLALALPWSLGAWRIASRRFLFDPLHFDVRSLMLLWLLGILAFFSIPSSKLVGYVLPCLPPFAYLIADAYLARRRVGDAPGSPLLGLALVLAMSICLSAPLLARHLDEDSFRPAAQAVADEFSNDDQIVMLDEYQYDMPFYLGTARPAWVVSNWSDPGIPRKDNWRKELYDAGQFDPEVMQTVLIPGDRMIERLCTAKAKTLWLWGRSNQDRDFPVLSKMTVAYNGPQRTLWRLDAADRQGLSACRGKPSND